MERRGDEATRNTASGLYSARAGNDALRVSAMGEHVDVSQAERKRECVYWQKGARGDEKRGDERRRDEKRGMRVEWTRGVDGECVCGCMGRGWAESGQRVPRVDHGGRWWRRGARRGESVRACGTMDRPGSLCVCVCSLCASVCVCVSVCAREQRGTETAFAPYAQVLLRSVRPHGGMRGPGFPEADNKRLI
jgi:hypothetical protein